MERVELNYSMKFAKMAKDNAAKRFTYISANGSSSKSWITYLKIKNQCEETVRGLGLNSYSILRPGMVTSTGNSDTSFSDRFMSCVPLIAKVKADNLAKAIIESSVQSGDKNIELSNKEVNAWAKKSTL